jgi:hypothetical protein
MRHLPNRSKAMDSHPTLVHFYYLVYFSDFHFLLTRLIIGLAFRNPHVGVEILTVRRMIDSQDRVPCHSLAPEMSDRNKSEGPVWRLPRYTGDIPRILEALISLSPKG